MFSGASYAYQQAKAAEEAYRAQQAAMQAAMQAQRDNMEYPNAISFVKKDGVWQLPEALN